MDEEDEMVLLDFRSPKAGLIKLLEQKMKKPDIDDTLGKVLDQFFQLTKEQSTFLANGILQMNFNEDALLLQCCGQYYSKMVDKLWEEMLQFHTRMVKYDQRAAKYCTDSDKQEARKEEVARLEERLNRGKRKKILLEESETGTSSSNGLYIFDVDQEEVSELFGSKVVFPLSEEFEIDKEEAMAPFEPDTDLLNEWWTGQSIIEEKRGRNYNSLFVAHYHAQRYRLKHYRTPTGDEMIYDWNDPEEFNSREGRLISYHHIKHLFEDNDKCLLPDENFTIAKLRLAFALKRKWLIRNKIHGKANYESYQRNWEKYEKDFFENESRKIQNMPQNTPKQLLRFYKALARKEELALKKVEELKALGVKDLPCVSFESVIIAPTKEGYEGIFDPYIPEDFEMSKQANFPEEILVDQTGKEIDEIALFGNVSKELDHASQSTEKQKKSDSGYLDTLCSSSGFVDDEFACESESEVAGNENFYEFDAENGMNKDDSGVSLVTYSTGICSDTPQAKAVEETRKSSDVSENIETSLHEKDSLIITDISPNVVENEPSNEMNKSIKEFLQRGSSDPNMLYEALEDSYFDENDSLVTILYNKPGRSSKVNNRQSESLILDYSEWPLPVEAMPAVNKNPINKCRRKKRKLRESFPSESISKRRKLSQRQVEKLKKSVTRSVRELKWEYFYSLNYQPENEEGEVIRFEQGEVSEDEDLFDGDDSEVVHDESDFTCDFHDQEECQEDENEHDQIESARIRESQDSGVVMDASMFESPEEEDCNSRDSLLFCEDILEETGNKLEINNIPGDPTLNSADTNDKEIASPPIEITEEMTSYEREREKVRMRVTEWKEYITPKLKQLEECDFDIHDYGTKILRNMNIEEAVPFHELVQGKSSAEVVRYFISSLQLANTLNVEICGATQGELSNDTFYLKLLSTERYHEHLKKYQAPSEESLKDKLMKMKELRKQQTKAQGNQAAKRVVEDRHSYRKVSKKARISNSPLLKRSTCDEDYIFQQPCSSRQADKQGDCIGICDDVGDLGLTTSRTNADISFTPSCDEDFLEQFDRLQQIHDSQLLSTPNKPIKVTRIDLIKPKLSLVNKL
ncbi:uncharacterized protein [Euwallacea similis]|uniref:uncharacterized protein isoform X2 n=1 Tax=Euwallacea similis TaxID=1736056 RepID=UPI00344B7E6F